MICRRHEGQPYRQGLNFMWMRLPDRWYFGIFLRAGNRIMGFRYRSHSFAVFSWITVK